MIVSPTDLQVHCIMVKCSTFAFKILLRAILSLIASRVSRCMATLVLIDECVCVCVCKSLEGDSAQCLVLRLS